MPIGHGNMYSSIFPMRGQHNPTSRSIPASCEAAHRSRSAGCQTSSAQHALVLLLASSCIVASDKAAADSSFFDNFATFDQKRWYVSDGWSNGDYQDCIWSLKNVRMGERKAELVLSDEPARNRRYTCAEVRTRELFKYGTYEVRMRAAAGPGVVTAFFTYIGPPQGKPHDEIDFEFLGKNRRAVQLNYWVNGNGKHGRDIDFQFDASADMHNYAFEWKPDGIRWFVDGKLVHEVRSRDGEPLPSHPGAIHFMLWNGVGPDMESWLQKFEYPGQPITATFEHVAFTEFGRPCQFPASIVCARTRVEGEMTRAL